MAGIYRKELVLQKPIQEIGMTESTVRTLHQLSDQRKIGYRSRRSEGEQVAAIRRALQTLLLAEPSDALAETIRWIDRGCLPG